MKKLLSSFGLALLVLLLASCSSSPPITYTISGDFIVVENPEPQELDDSDEATTEASSDSEADSIAPLDAASVTISVTYETTNEDGETETVELASGGFTDGKISFIGEINEPTTIKISADVSDENQFSVETLLTAEHEVKFALMDFWGEFPYDQLVLVEGAHLSKDLTKKFTVSADLSAVDSDLSSAIATARGMQFDEEGELQRLDLGKILLVDKKFVIEADVDEPTVISGYVSTGADYYGMFTAVAEPNVQIEVFPLGDGSVDELLVTSDTGMHKNLIESWQQSDEYLAKLVEYDEAFKQYQAEWEAKQEAAESEQEGDQDIGTQDSDEATVADGTEEQDSEESSKSLASEDTDADSLSEADADESLALEDSIVQPAEGCEHAAQESEQSVGIAAASDYEYPEYYQIYLQKQSIQSNALQKIAKEMKNPLESLLAMELGAFSTRSENPSDAFPVYDKLAQLLDEDLVVRRVSPARDRFARQLESQENDASLSPGQKAPEFTLANHDGTEVALYDVIAEKEMVLIDFWASWCGPCIADFPELKRLYAAYNDLGFEIVGVSIDSALEDWEQGSIDNELPWIDLGEMDGWEGATATMYGVLAIPKGYLLDSQGCILEKNIRPARLEEVLVAQYGEVPESSESDAETESDEIDSGSDEMGG
ncbi:MAG: redoxin domain-containing protein [Gammaproteobacteria bacterium]|nr:redoxin domain-containing protein [Gammaproteobacteria bacterium]MYD79010.1 redoxin domain-containing protein [Gammaproteobacteria bacterium]